MLKSKERRRGNDSVIVKQVFVIYILVTRAIYMCDLYVFRFIHSFIWRFLLFACWLM